MLRRLLSWLGSADDRPAEPADRAARIREIGRDPLAHGHDATQDVLAGLSDESPLVRTTAAEVLGSVEVYHELVAADPLVERLDDPERSVRLAAAEALTVTTDATVVDDVLPYALADDPGVRAAGAVGLYHALSRVTYEFAPAQVEALFDAFAATNAGDAGAEDDALAREYLLSAIARGVAARDLSALDADRTDILVTALDDTISVSGQAAALLGQVDDETARTALRDARESHADERVRDAAAEALTDGAE
ncbi:HEAT repeat domain-containing protein [Halorientalis pallida]|uniref:HEAT repeat-containing protein n=1 Tax=Halorientalis pallida TaxID=2479928 RepID=A0A498KXG7_9EURY|nr:HEAT repeat domain-containing protein [Halorientalis pallida]RXK48603.1 hypothetical protein EAF64_13085 [Halorientalis pallida]